jgi:hypothetical protein
MERQRTHTPVIVPAARRHEGMKVFRGVVLPPGRSVDFTRRKLMLELPRWKGELQFRHARPEEKKHLRWLYRSAWGKGVQISERQLTQKMMNFSHGQIVGCRKGDDTPVSMINIMLALYDPKVGIPAGYANVTGDKTFSTSMPPEELFEAVRRRQGEVLPVAYCVSIAVPPKYKKGGYAYETLNYARLFSIVNGLAPMPYSAPRGLAAAKAINPDLDIMDYLHMTRRTSRPFPSYEKKMKGRVGKVHDAFIVGVLDGEPKRSLILSDELFNKYNAMETDSLFASMEETAFWMFLQSDAREYEDIYRRPMTIEDFCVLTGRSLLDPVIGMHMSNGARFLRSDSGAIEAVFPDSRPEDRTALGYNIVLTYTYHELLGHKFIR